MNLIESLQLLFILSAMIFVLFMVIVVAIFVYQEFFYDRKDE